MKEKKDKIVRNVVVTGATSGIGKATATIFAKNGYNVIITGRREGKLKELKSYLTGKYGVDIVTLCFDIRKNEEVVKAVNSLKKKYKKIDVLINNAGLAKGLSPVNEGKLEDWEMMIDTNIKGLLYITRQISPMMVEAGAGHIINVCSTAGHEVYPNGNVYSATKYAVNALTKSMRLDLYKHNIRVSQVSPGHVEETEFALVRFDGDEKRAKIYDDFTPLSSKDVADTIYYISSRPKHVNIQDILIMSTQQAGSNFINRNGRLV
jgi:NADP-dependent 3-hydroxy acid dehydrogenase YdfG